METVRNIKEATKNYPQANEFALSGNHLEALVKCFLKSLSNENMIGWIKEMSLTPRFDEEYALKLDEYRSYHVGRAAWERLIQLSMIEARDDGFFEMHKLFQDNLRRLVEPNNAAKVHAWSKDYWLQIAREIDWKLRGFGWVHWRLVNMMPQCNSMTNG